MKLTDGKRTVNILMEVWRPGIGFLPDWSADFFDAGLLPYDDDTDAFSVSSVDYCIEQAREWEEEDENNTVTVTEL